MVSADAAPGRAEETTDWLVREEVEQGEEKVATDSILVTCALEEYSHVRALRDQEDVGAAYLLARLQRNALCNAL